MDTRREIEGMLHWVVRETQFGAWSAADRLDTVYGSLCNGQHQSVDADPSTPLLWVRGCAADAGLGKELILVARVA
jgi:hypothetical protein